MNQEDNTQHRADLKKRLNLLKNRRRTKYAKDVIIQKAIEKKEGTQHIEEVTDQQTESEYIEVNPNRM